VRAADQAELDAAAAEITEFERRDVKFKEDRRHCKAKLKKAEEKLAKDAARLQVRLTRVRVRVSASVTRTKSKFDPNAYSKVKGPIWSHLLTWSLFECWQ